jgi:uridine phosphorylase
MVIPTDSGLNDVITSILVEKNIGFKTGPVWTTEIYTTYDTLSLHDALPISSRHYGISSGDTVIHTDSGLNGVITSILVEKNIGFKTGPVWTTDAIYRETPSKIKHYGGLGALAVEMELSALLSVAAFRGIRLSALLTVSDEIGSLNWKTGFSDPRFKAGRSSMAAAIGDVVERILYG